MRQNKIIMKIAVDASLAFYFLNGVNTVPKELLKLVKFARRLHASIKDNEGSNFEIHLEMFPSLRNCGDNPFVSPQVFLEERKIVRLIKENVVYCKAPKQMIKHYDSLYEELKRQKLNQLCSLNGYKPAQPPAKTTFSKRFCK